LRFHHLYNTRVRRPLLLPHPERDEQRRTPRGGKPGANWDGANWDGRDVAVFCESSWAFEALHCFHAEIAARGGGGGGASRHAARK
jgi:hypothetical protein